MLCSSFCLRTVNTYHKLSCSAIIQIRDSLRRVLEQRVEAALKEHSNWLLAARDRTSWCASQSTSLPDVNLKLTSVCELDSSMQTGIDMRDAGSRKLEKLKDVLDRETVAHLQELVLRNEERQEALRGTLDSTRCVEVD